MQIDLWSFANRLYCVPNVEQLCLKAQHQGANVCLILCALWLESQDKDFNKALAEKLNHCARKDEDLIVRPLRALREQWKCQALEDEELRALRENIKALELRAEKTLLGKLEALCAHTATGKANGQWLSTLSMPVIWQDQELRQWQKLLAEL